MKRFNENYTIRILSADLLLISHAILAQVFFPFLQFLQIFIDWTQSHASAGTRRSYCLLPLKP